MGDLRYAARLILKRPGFSLLIVLILGLGIGANTAVFGLVREILLRPLPFEEPERLVRVSGSRPSRTGGPLSYPDFLDLRERNRVFSELALVDRSDPVLTDRGEPIKLVGSRVSPSYLIALGVEPELGRFFLPAEEEFGRHRVAVLSHALWQSRFAADPGIVGRTIELWGTYTYTVVGVMPPDFEDTETYFDLRPQIWRPLSVQPEHYYRDGRSYDSAVARLAPGVTLAQARDDLDRIARELQKEYPEENFEEEFQVESLLDATVGDVRPALSTLTIAVALVLLIACANVANMLLARSAGRQRELAVRSSLGASTVRLIRQLLVEGLVLAAIAGVAGLTLTAWTAELLVKVAAEHLPRLGGLPIDGGMLAFAGALVLATTLACGIVPALRSARGDLLPDLHEQPGTPSGGRSRLQSVLAAVEVAVALALLIGAGLLVRSLWQLWRVDPGFDPRGVVAFDADVESEQLPALLEQVRGLPGVESAGATSILPLVDNYSCDGFIIDAAPLPPGQEECAEFRVVTAGVFRALGIPLLRGRLFTDGDVESSAPVALIDQAMAERYWPGQDPVGQRLTKAGGDRISREIVGVVGSARHFGLDSEPMPQFFIPQAQWPHSFAQTLVVKTAGAAADLAPAIREEIRTRAPDAAIRTYTLAEVVRGSIAAPRFRAQLIGLFAGLAGLLAVLGVYGVMACSVRQRRRELGIRMALGADRRAVVRKVLGAGMSITGIGVLCGLLGGVAIGRLLTRFLFGIPALDVTTFVATSVFVVLGALAASWLPAYRASRLDPLVVLRHE